MSVRGYLILAEIFLSIGIVGIFVWLNLRPRR